MIHREYIVIQYKRLRSSLCYLMQGLCDFQICQGQTVRGVILAIIYNHLT